MSKHAPEKNIMFSYWDGGRGHLARVRNLAIEALKRGHEVSFITSEKYAGELGALAAAENIHIIANKPLQTSSPPYPFPLYSHAFRHAQRLRGLGFDNTQWIRETTEQEIVAIQKSKPDVIVNDYRDTIRTSAEVADVPVAGITHTTGHLNGYRLGSWVKPPEGAILPDCKESFNEVRAEYSLPKFDDELYMFSGDVNIIPSIPALDPLQHPSSDSHYVGMISQWESDPGEFKPLSNPGVHNVFSYVGEATRPPFGYEDMLQQAMGQAPELGFYVVGNPDKYTSSVVRARQQEDSVRVAPFIPGSAALANSSVLLTHGGHSTTCLALSLGKPLIGIGAYQTEAATTLRNVDKAGAGIYLPHSEGPLERVQAPDLGDNIDIFGYWRTGLNGESIRQSIFNVLEDPAYTENASRVGGELVAYGGVRRALDIIEEM